MQAVIWVCVCLIERSPQLDVEGRRDRGLKPLLGAERGPGSCGVCGTRQSPRKGGAPRWEARSAVARRGATRIPL